MRYRLDGVITVVDAVNGEATLDQHMESVKQAAVADRIVLTKTDLLDKPARRDATTRLRARLHTLNPAAPILDAADREATTARLLGCGLFDPERKTPDVRRWLAEEAYAEAATGVGRVGEDHDHRHARGRAHPHGHAHDPNRHDARIRAFTLAAESAIPAAAFEMFIDLVRSLHGPKLLRLKGIVKIAEEPGRPLVIHGVQHVMHPPVRLAAWPDGDERSRIVLITRDLEPQDVRALFDAFLERSAPDQPDRAALLDNPLVPFGGADR
jgi:G3E family GTPase